MSSKSTSPLSSSTTMTSYSSSSPTTSSMPISMSSSSPLLSPTSMYVKSTLKSSIQQNSLNRSLLLAAQQCQQFSANTGTAAPSLGQQHQAPLSTSSSSSSFVSNYPPVQQSLPSNGLVYSATPPAKRRNNSDSSCSANATPRLEPFLAGGLSLSSFDDTCFNIVNCDFQFTDFY